MGLNLDFLNVRRKKATTNIQAKASSSWALIPVDGKPIRNKAKRDYEKVLRDLTAARHALAQFEKHDQPGFTQWVSREFGALVTELRETSHNLQAKRELLFEIQSEAMLSNSSYARAYERVMQQREQAAAAAKEETNHEGHDDPDPSRASSDDPFAEFDEAFAEAEARFREAFGGEPHGSAHGKPGHPDKTVSARLKELYRAVVRRLHPDKQKTLTPQRKDWWHQAQSAYQARDIEQLELILTLCEIDDQGSTAQTSVSLLRRITLQFRNSLRALKKQLRQYQLDIAWDFSGRQDRASLAGQMERSLRGELLEMQRALHVINSQIEAWSKQAQMGRRRAVGRRRSSAFHPEFLF